MRRITFLFAAALGLGIPVDALAQGFSGGSSFGGGGFGGGSSFGGGGFGGGSSFGGGGFSGGSTRGGMTFSGGGGFSGGSFSGGQSFSGGTGFSGTGRTGAGGRPAGRAGSTATAGVTIDPTNFLAASYGNPLYLGRPGGQVAGAAGAGGGGFGQPSLGAYQTTVIQNTGALAGRGTTGLGTTGLGATGMAGRGTTALGGRGMTGMTGMAGRTGAASVGGGFAGVSIGGVAPITYAAQVRFPAAPPAVSPQLRAALQDLIGRSSAIRQPAAVNVTVDGDVVVLRGRVASDEERRLIEGMVRLEPGVREVRNELEVR